LKGQRRVISSVSPETVIAGSDPETSEVVVKDGEEEGLPLEGSEHGANETHGGRDGEDGEAEPINLLVPILPGNRRKGFLCLQGMGHIVVWDVEVGGEDVVGLLDGWGHGGRLKEERGQVPT
jgi:hypothetical protein